MKTIGIFGVVVIAGIALQQPAQGRPRGGGHSFSPAHSFSAPARHYSNHSRSFSGNTARYYRSTPRYSSQGAYRNRAYTGPRHTVNRTTALKPNVYSSNRRYTANRTATLNRRTDSAANPRLSANRRNTLAAQGITSQGRVVAHQTRNWDRSRDHYWHGHRCHWHNNSWVIIDPWFWGYGYGWGGYPYGYSYYDDGYAPEQYAQSDYDSGYGDSSVSQIQEALAREGYYHGAIDGSVGPATRNALRRFQRDRGLEATGQIDQAVIDALRRR